MGEQWSNDPERHSTHVRDILVETRTHTEGAGLVVKPAPSQSLIPNFGMTPFNFDRGVLGFVFENGVPEEAREALSRAVQEQVTEDLPIVLSPDTMAMLMKLAHETLIHWAKCEYLRRDVHGVWIYEAP